MKRVIKFRGKRLDNGVWCYGHYTFANDTHTIHWTNEDDAPWWADVDPDTIGQFTGLTDKNGTEIYEGDILRLPPKDEWDKTSYVGYEVFWHDNDCCERHIGFQMNRHHFYGNVCGTYDFRDFAPKTTKQMIVIGNIHDTPELLNTILK